MLDELQDRGDEGGRTVLIEYLNRVRLKPALLFEARFLVAPGQQTQLDWGEMGSVLIDGITTKVYAFIQEISWGRT